MSFLRFLLILFFLSNIDSYASEVVVLNKGAIEKTFSLNEKVFVDLELKNTTDSKLNIVKVNTSCTCAKVLSYPRSLMPQERGVLRLQPVTNKEGAQKGNLYISIGSKIVSIPYNFEVENTKVISIFPRKLLNFGSFKDPLMRLQQKFSVKFQKRSDIGEADLHLSYDVSKLEVSKLKKEFPEYVLWEVFVGLKPYVDYGEFSEKIDCAVYVAAKRVGGAFSVDVVGNHFLGSDKYNYIVEDTFEDKKRLVTLALSRDSIVNVVHSQGIERLSLLEDSRNAKIVMQYGSYDYTEQYIVLTLNDAKKSLIRIPLKPKFMPFSVNLIKLIDKDCLYIVPYDQEVKIAVEKNESDFKFDSLEGGSFVLSRRLDKKLTKESPEHLPMKLRVDEKLYEILITIKKNTATISHFKSISL